MFHNSWLIGSDISADFVRTLGHPEVGIYKRKQDSKKTRKHHAFDQESDQEKKKKRKKTRSRPTKRPRKKEKLSFFFSFINPHLCTHWHE